MSLIASDTFLAKLWVMISIVGLADETGCASALSCASRRRIVGAARGNSRVGEDNNESDRGAVDRRRDRWRLGDTGGGGGVRTIYGEAQKLLEGLPAMPNTWSRCFDKDGEWATSKPFSIATSPTCPC